MKKLIPLFIVLVTIVCCKEEQKAYDASGSFEAVETIIAAEANGKILQLNVEEGQQLDSGLVVGYLDSVQLHVSKLQLMQNKKAILSGRPDAGLQLAATKKELANAELDRDKIVRLVNGGVASQNQLDDANARIATLQASIKAQESSLQIATNTINEQGNTVVEQMKSVQDQLKKTVIVNPMKGTVLTKYAQQYEMAVIGKPLYKMADLSTIILRAYITGDQLVQVKIGQQVKVSADDGKGGLKQTQGVITWINDKAEFTPKSIQTKNDRANLVYAIKVSVKNDGYFKIGMYGELSWNK
ncbi:MAG TPA: efflux RND transporter periplasmic adaptor subunit [Phnomibacter sp.]|nr:efflux RND transporter periplasmic adaptor subunit [Phnomibacter sp.]